MFQLENNVSDKNAGGTATLDPPVMPEHETRRPNRSLWTRGAGTAVMIGGVIMPSIVLALMAVNNPRAATELLLRHPVETLVQYALLLCIPFGNYIAWRRLCRHNLTKVARIGILSGLSAGSSALASVLSLAAYILKYPTIEEVTQCCHDTEAALCATVWAGSLVVSLYLMRQLYHTWETDGAKTSQLLYCLAGLFLSLFAAGASEARQVVIRTFERATITDDAAQRSAALDALRIPLLDSTRELKMDINDPRSGGLSGMFLGIDPGQRRQLFFALTAKPYESITELATDDSTSGTIASSSYDRFLASHVVGDLIPGFSVMRSQIRGSVNPKTLTSNLDWTFVLRNKNHYEQEARAEIALPPGAVISNMTLWMNGKPKDATVSATEQAEGAYKWVVVSKRDPALVRYLGKGRVFVQCFPVPANKEIKLSLSMTAPLKLDSGTQASLALPRLVASNFAPSATYDLRLRSTGNLELAAAGLHPLQSASTDRLFVGKVKDQDAKNSALSVVASRPMTVGAFAARDPAYGGYSVESVKEVQNNTPHDLVVVIDGSQGMKEYAKEISDVLSRVSKLMPTSVILADSDAAEASEPEAVPKAIKQLTDMSFNGGHDNLPSVIKAAEIAGEKDRSAVLWIHGPQPAFNEEIYITSRSANKPEFYELALDDGWTNASAFFKNHQEIGPMIPVMRNGRLHDDLDRYLSQWQPGGHHYSVQLLHMQQKPDCPMLSGTDALDLTTLCAAHSCKQLIADNKRGDAARLATSYHIVTPVTAGVVLEKSSDYQRWNLDERNTQGRHAPANLQTATRLANNDSLSGFGNQSSVLTDSDSDQTVQVPKLQGAAIATIGPQGAESTAAPSLQGATNGTLGPQGADATYVTGLNTAGTVRVNNLANLEAVLDLIANGIEVLGIALGITYCVKAFIETFKPKTFAIALSMIAFGLATPSMINWLVASARDSNLFN